MPSPNHPRNPQKQSAQPAARPHEPSASLPQGPEHRRERSVYVAQFKNGESIYKNSLELDHELLRRLRYAVRQVNAPAGVDVFAHTFRFGIVIGADNVVRRLPGDQITYVQLRPSGNYYPVVSGAQSDRQITKAISFAVSRAKNGVWHLLKCNIGELAHPSPTDRRRFHGEPEKQAAAIAFWNDRAQCREALESQGRIIPGSEQKECPWSSR